MLLLDEPFGSLDAKSGLSCRRWLRELHDEVHITSVFVTHDQDEALEVSDRQRRRAYVASTSWIAGRRDHAPVHSVCLQLLRETLSCFTVASMSTVPDASAGD